MANILMREARTTVEVPPDTGKGPSPNWQFFLRAIENSAHGARRRFFPPRSAQKIARMVRGKDFGFCVTMGS
jgi:hypothetical protein